MYNTGKLAEIVPVNREKLYESDERLITYYRLRRISEEPEKYKKLGKSVAREVKGLVRLAEAEITDEYMGLVKNIVRYRSMNLSRGIDYDDLMSAVHIVFVKALRNFDPYKGSFKTYLERKVQGRVTDEIRDKLSYNGSPRSVGRFKIAIKEFENTNGRLPAVDDLLTSSEKFEGKNKRNAESALILYVFRQQDINLEVSGEESAFQRAYRSELAAKLKDCVNKLSETEAEILGLYYFEDKLKSEISRAMRMDHHKTTAIHAKALLKLRLELEDKGVKSVEF